MGNLSKEELLKILQAVREVERNQPERAIGVFVKVNNMTEEELAAIMKQVKPDFQTVKVIEGAGAAYNYQPV